MSDEIILENVKPKELADEIKKHATQSRSEEDIKMRIEYTLRSKVFDKWNVPWATYEKKTIVSGARKDALYGHVVIEYKAPGKLDSKTEFNKAKEQIKKYISEDGKDPKYYNRYFGVIIDGNKISFIRFRKNEWEEQDTPLEVNAQTILRLLESIRGLKRKPIDAEFLLIDFGPKSPISKKAVLSFYKKLNKSKTPRTQMLFNDWRRVFSQVCSYSNEKLQKLADFYDFDEENVDPEQLFFCIHTYYTILMKLMTSEIVTLFADSLLGSYLKKIEEAYYHDKKGKFDEMQNELKELEEGGIFSTLGIKNFLEADYFAWYLDDWNEEIAASIFEINKQLLDYEPATVELNPERVKDLFKRLYQNLVPRDIRHKLGEYFTPDWLAELLLEEIQYDGNPEKRVLDPACGSGTFLVLTIKKIREYSEEHFLDKRELLMSVINNVRGIDLNPLAVLASKANYLISLADLLRYRPKEGIEIPIYLADSISVERTVTLYGEAEYTLHTTEGKFWITKEVIDKNLLYPVLSIINEGVKIGWNKKQLESILDKKVGLSHQSIQSFLRLYEKIQKLEHMGKNKIWTSLLKNSFAPMLMGKFDYVIGNPPWINWETLPEFYRNTTKDLWGRYGLLEKTQGMGLGKVKRDISMLFVARCFDLYTKEEGRLSFLIPFTTYKTQAGAGFRKYLASKTGVSKVHDLVELHPFEGALTRTSLLSIRKGYTKFPVPCLMWSNPRGAPMPQEVELQEVKKMTKQFEMILTPIKKGDSGTPWMLISEKALNAINRIVGKSPWYQAHAGIVTLLNGVYWVDIISKQHEKLLIKNTQITGLKKKVKSVTELVESGLLYPLIRGRNVKRWHIEEPTTYILLPVDKDGRTLTHSELKTSFPQTYKYFMNYRKDLTTRGGEPYKSKLELYNKLSFDIAEKKCPPFYWLFNAEPSLKKYKVVWKRIAGGVTGKAVSFASAVVPPYKTSGYVQKGKPVVLNDSLILISFNNEDEAYYVSGVLNSSPVLFTIASYTYELRMETHITQYINIPLFNIEKKIFLEISDLSKKAHQLAKENKLEELKQVEEQIDKTVAELYGISDDELEEIKKTLRILKEGESEETEESDEEQQTLPMGTDLTIKIDPLNIFEWLEHELTINFFNNSKKQITINGFKVQLEGKDILVVDKSKKINAQEGIKGPLKIPKLSKGEYNISIEVSYQMENEEKQLQEKRTLYVEPKKEAKKKGSWNEFEKMMK